MDRTVIIFLTDLPLWSMKNGMGAPSFFKTVKSYIDRNIVVYLITTNEGKGEKELFDSNHLYIIKKDSYERLLLIPKISYFANLIRHFEFARKSDKIIREIIDKEKTNHIILYAYELFGVQAAKKIAHKFSLPFVTRFQGTILCGRNRNLLDRIRFPLHFQALRTKSDLMIMTDDGTQGLEIVRELGNYMNNIQFWKNGLDILELQTSNSKDFDRNKFKESIGVKKEDQILLTVSRLAEWKRVDRAIRILSDERLGSEHIKLVIVGDGSSRQALEELCSELGIQDRVVFAGSQLQKDVYKYMLSADIFLSLYDISNVGNPLLEAMALGKPIITLDVGDTGLVINNGKNGILVSPDEIAEIPLIIQNLLSNGDKMHELGNSAKTYALENFYTWRTRMDMEYAEVMKLSNSYESE